MGDGAQVLEELCEDCGVPVDMLSNDTYQQTMAVIEEASNELGFSPDPKKWRSMRSGTRGPFHLTDSSPKYEIVGSVAPGFEAVRQTMEKNYSQVQVEGFEGTDRGSTLLLLLLLLLAGTRTLQPALRNPPRQDCC
jgi:hypothetical protein